MVNKNLTKENNFIRIKINTKGENPPARVDHRFVSLNESGFVVGGTNGKRIFGDLYEHSLGQVYLSLEHIC